MLVSQAIKKAIEEGYTLTLEEQEKPLPQWDLLHGSWNYRILLDPFFWQSLGKSTHPKTKKAWRGNFDRFFNHIAESKDIDSFFKEL